MAAKTRGSKNNDPGAVNGGPAGSQGQDTRPDRELASLGVPEELMTPEIKKYQAMLGSNPTSRVFATLAELYRKQGMYDEAIGLCIKGLKHHPDYLSGHAVLGLAYFDKGMLREAAGELERVVSANPDHLMATRALGDIMLAEGDNRRATDYFTRVLTLAPDDEDIRKKLESMNAGRDSAIGSPPDRPGPPVTADTPPPEEIIEGEGLEIIEAEAASPDVAADARIIKGIRETLEGGGIGLSVDEMSDILVSDEEQILRIAAPYRRPVGAQTAPGTRMQVSAADLPPLYRAIEHLQIGIVITDLDGTVHYANRAASESHGWAPEDPVGRNLRDFFPAGLFHPMTMHEILDKKSFAKDTMNVRKDGSVFPVRITYDIVESQSKEPNYIIVGIDDLTRHKDVDEDLWQFAIKDAESGLYNRRYFLSKIAEEIKRAERIGYPLCLMVIAVENLKSYQAAGGPRKGQRVAVEIGKIARQSIRKEVDSAYRLTEDEFAVILPTATDQKAHIVAQRLIEKATKRLPGIEIRIGAASRQDHRSIESLIAAAEKAAYSGWAAPVEE